MGLVIIYFLTVHESLPYLIIILKVILKKLKKLLNQINSFNFNKLFTKFVTSLLYNVSLMILYFVSEKEEQSLENLKNNRDKI